MYNFIKSLFSSIFKVEIHSSIYHVQVKVASYV